MWVIVPITNDGVIAMLGMIVSRCVAVLVIAMLVGALVSTFVGALVSMLVRVLLRAYDGWTHCGQKCGSGE
jgi:hypothetical protein